MPGVFFVCFYSFKICFEYLKCKVEEGKKQRGISIHQSNPYVTARAGPAQADIRSRELHWVLHVGAGPRALEPSPAAFLDQC